MRMIPDFIDRSVNKGEKLVFDLLKDCDVQGFALHSLNVADHKYKKWGEIDFLLITAMGIIGLEVKGGPVSRANGRWYVGREARENPYDQIRSATYAVHGWLRNEREVRCDLGWGVVFPESVRVPETPEHPGRIQASVDECGSSKKFAAWLRDLEAYWRDKSSGGKSLSSKEQGSILKLLRPDFDVAIPFGRRLRTTDDEVKRLTDEQMDRLDGIEENDRIMLRGGAGTGKTFLAMEVCRREAAAGRSVLFVARGDRFVRSLEEAGAPSGVTLVRYSTLPDLGPDRTFDVLVVDEGQDLLNLEAIDRLGTRVEGGLERGRWRWFMDDQHQSGFHADEQEEAVDLLKSLGAMLQRLTVNCRNTPEIVRMVQSATGADIGVAKVEGSGMTPTVAFAAADELAASCRTRVRSWIVDEQIPKSEIKVLVGSLDDWPDLQVGMPGEVEVVDIGTFKGLESGYVAVLPARADCSIDSIENLLYTGLTRARAGLWIGLPSVLEEAWYAALSRNVTRMLEITGS